MAVDIFLCSVSIKTAHKRVGGGRHALILLPGTCLLPAAAADDACGGGGEGSGSIPFWFSCWFWWLLLATATEAGAGAGAGAGRT